MINIEQLERNMNRSLSNSQLRRFLDKDFLRMLKKKKSNSIDYKGGKL